MHRKTLAIIGAGPKGIAIAAKAKVLSLLGFDVPRIAIFEKHGIGHNWKAHSGYTNGDLLLGTPPDKDVGFPYYSFCWGDSVNGLVNRLMKCLSWQNYLINSHCFAEWIDRGRLAPPHHRFANYLQWVYQKISDDIELVHEDVQHIDHHDHQWILHSCDSEGIRRATPVDALVMTGPGKTHAPFSIPEHPSVLKTENFWRTYADFHNIRNKAIALVGAGENAATVAVTLARSHRNNRIDIISPHAMNYTRGESYSENHIYTDPFQGNWHLFTRADRKNFISRTDRGVFSVDIKREIDSLSNVEVIPGECRQIRVDSLDQIILDIRYNGVQEDRIYDMAIITTGFDHAAFVQQLLSQRAIAHITTCAQIPSFTRDALEDAISETLAVRNVEPTLHLPMLAGFAQGPGFPNLSSLGRLSDHILSHHVSLDDRGQLDDNGIVQLMLS